MDFRLRVKKFINGIGVDYTRDSFIRECKLYNQDGALLWEQYKKEILKSPKSKRYKIFNQGESTYIFYNGFTEEELINIINPKTDIYILKHKDVSVLKFTFNQDKVIKIINIVNKNHLPYPLFYKCDEYKFSQWFNDRLIPATRYQYDRFVKALQLFDANSRIQMILDSKALSLSDCYWVTKEDSKDTWKKVNYFDNTFNTDLLDFYLASPNTTYKNKLPVILNPAMGLTGYLPKAWTIKNGQRILLKRGLERNAQVLNEIIVSNIAKDAGIDTLLYTMEDYKDYKCSACPCFCSNELELVSAMDLTQNISDDLPLDKQLQNYEDLVKAKIPNIRKNIDQMIIIDYITANEDRHWNNFGVLRNPDTLEIKKIAPLFDYGNSLWYNFMEDCIGNENRNKIFEGITATKTLDYVKDFNVLNYSKLEKALDIIPKIYTNPFTRNAIYKACKNRLSEILKRVKK